MPLSAFFNERLLSVAPVFGIRVATIVSGVMPARVWALRATAIVAGGVIMGATVAFYVGTNGVFEARGSPRVPGGVIGIGRIEAQSRKGLSVRKKIAIML